MINVILLNFQSPGIMRWTFRKEFIALGRLPLNLNSGSECTYLATILAALLKNMELLHGNTRSWCYINNENLSNLTTPLTWHKNLTVVWWLTATGKTTLGVPSSPANPALSTPEPLSITIATRLSEQLWVVALAGLTTLIAPESLVVAATEVAWLLLRL